MHIHPVLQRFHIPWRDTSKDGLIGWAAVACMFVCASTYNTFAKSLGESLNPITLVFLSELLTGFFVLFSFGTVPTLRKVAHLPKASLKPLLCIGVISGVVAPLLWFAGLQHTSVLNAALFSNTEMLFLTLFGVLFMGEIFSRMHAMSILTIVFGLVVIVLKGFSESFEPQMGDAFLVLACASYGIGSIIFRKYLHHGEPQIVMLFRSLTAVAVFIAASPFLSHSLVAEITAFPLQAVPLLIGFAFVSRFLAVFSFYEAMDHLPLSTVSLSMNFPLIGSVAFGAWFYAEPILPYHLVGGALIIAGALALEIAGIHGSDRHLQQHLHNASARPT